MAEKWGIPPAQVDDQPAEDIEIELAVAGVDAEVADRRKTTRRR